jgi:hypothetical protein
VRFIAQISTEFQISQTELDFIYSLMGKKVVFDSDPDLFLKWCKNTCDKQTSTNIMLDLEEVGKFFSKKMSDGDLELSNLSLIGFELL